jgi:hypothetical protein
VRVLSWSGGDSRWEGVPEVLIARDEKGNERAIPLEHGLAYATAGARRFVLFDSHPRVLIDGWEESRLALQLFLKLAKLKKLVRPFFVLHLIDPLEGGLSELERRALIQLSHECGAGAARVMESGPVLSPPEVLAIARRKEEFVR